MIVNHIRGEAWGIERAINRAEREIELLREYRARLVADVVTGQLDVRAAASVLPELSGEHEAISGLEPDDAVELAELESNDE